MKIAACIIEAMRSTPATAIALALAAVIGGCAAEQQATQLQDTAPSSPAVPGGPAELADRMPERDGLAHRWELRAFKDGRIEVFMDGEAVPQERIARSGNRVAVTDAAGKVVERLDLPESWTPAHGEADGAAYRGLDGRELVPPPTMLGGKLEPLPQGAIAHLRAEQLSADASKCSYVASVIPGLPMAQAGIMPHDVISSVNGNPDASPEAIRALLRSSAPGTQLTFKLERGGASRTATVTLAPWEARHMVRLVDPRAARQMAEAEDRAKAEAAARAEAEAAAARARQEAARLAAEADAARARAEADAARAEAARAAASEAAAAAAAKAAAEAAARQPAADASKVSELDRRMGDPASRAKRGRPQPAPQPSAGAPR